MENNEPMAAKAEAAETSEFETVKKRLEEIAHAVDADDISLDAALDLYEEAVKLGLEASSLLEVGIEVPAEPEPEVAASSEPEAPSDASTTPGQE